MKITILGCGNAFSKLNYNQCFMLEEEGRRMLIDYGAKAPAALDNAGIDISTIDDIYISHLHGDHIGGLEEMAFSRYDWINRPQNANQRFPKYRAPLLFGNRHLLEDLWNKSLRGGLESMEGFDANLETYFELHPLQPNEIFRWMGWECSLVQQVHIMTGSVISGTYGLFMEKEGSPTLYFTTDSQYCSPEQVATFYNKADIIFQDCECIGVNTEKRHMDFTSKVHANYAQLAGYPSANNTVLSKEITNKMWLSHYQDFVSKDEDYLGNTCYWQPMALEDGFKGFVHVGQVIEI